MSTPFSHFFTKINHFSPLEQDFTEVLNTIALKPKLLYFCGKMPQNMSKIVPENTEQTRTKRPKTVAIVGSRHNTRYGEEIAYQLAYDLAKRGVIIVSGLAFGIDSIAHRGCLAAGGITVAVLGTRIDDIYPKSHLPLAKEIITHGGAIISEYAPFGATEAPLAPGEAGFNGSSWVNYATENDAKSSSNASLFPPAPYLKRRIDSKISFLYRNRLIAGLADAVVVVEAAEKSGSLNTAAHALNQGKDVFAVPGNVTNPYSQGCNKLIRQGAIPYTKPQDVLELLFPEDYLKTQKSLVSHHLIGDTDVETKILQAMAAGARSGEAIMKIAHLPPEVFNEATTFLEIKSRIRSLGANTWGLV